MILKQDLESPHQTEILNHSSEKNLSSSEKLIFTSKLLQGGALETNIVMFPGQPLLEREMYVQELVMPPLRLFFWVAVLGSCLPRAADNSSLLIKSFLLGFWGFLLL